MDIDLLVKLTSRAWALPILTQLHRGVPARQAALLAATGAGRSAFTPSLHHLITLGLLERNPGHGHPLRPEYRLTADGKAVAALADRLDQAVPDHDDQKLIRRAWSIPVLSVSLRPKGFSEIKEHLGRVTDRALSQSLQNLRGHDWVARSLDVAHDTARPLYTAQDTGQIIGEIFDVRV